MKKLTSKQIETLLKNSKPIEYALEAGLADTPLTPEFYAFMQPFQRLHEKAQVYHSFGGKHVSYRNVKGSLKSVTWYEFIIKGLPYLQKGLKEILNIKDEQQRTSEMIRFDAIVSLVCSSSSSAAMKYSKLTEEMIQERIVSQIRTQPAYDESRWTTELKSVFGYTAIGAGTNDYSKVLGYIE